MHPISKQIERIIKYCGESNNSVASSIGVDRSTFTRWFSSESEPRSTTVNKIAQYFNMPIDFFYSDLSVEDFLETAKNDAAKSGRVFEVAAGQGRINDGPGIRLEHDPNSEYSKVRIVGDSMYPVLHDGDIVTVHHQPETSPSDLTVIKINGDESTIKNVEVTDTGVWVRAINKDVFEDRFYTVQEVLSLPVTIIGKAIELKREL